MTRWSALPAALLLLTLPAFLPAHAFGATGTATTKETSLQRIQRSVVRINQEASTPQGEAAVVRRLSAQLGIPPDSLRAQRSAWALGYGEVAMVHGFARAARPRPVTAQRVVDLRRSGKEWNAIAKELGVSVDAVASRVRRSVAPAKPAPAVPKKG